MEFQVHVVQLKNSLTAGSDKYVVIRQVRDYNFN